MPGGPTMKIMGLGVLCREAKGLESLGVSHSEATRPGPAGTLGRWASYDEFLSMNRFLEQALWRFRLIPWGVDEEANIYVLVLSE
jgi:hypothetical protein